MICGHCVQKTDLMGDSVILRATQRSLQFRLGSSTHRLQDHGHRPAREHLTNTYTQVLIFEALGVPMPRFGHVPVINEPELEQEAIQARHEEVSHARHSRPICERSGWIDEQIDTRDD